MKKTLLFFFLSCFLFTCDDGDVIVVEFDFDDTFEVCKNLIFYNTKDNPAEAFSLLLTDDPDYNTIEDILAFELSSDGVYATVVTPEKEFFFNGDTNRFNYRTFNTISGDYFCSDIPPADIVLLSDDESTSGSATITTILIEDDGDGIPAWFEDEDLDGDQDPTTNPTDRDGDGIPDYLDDDDDGDNVRTVAENPNFDEATGGLVEPQDSDSDGIPDYLDDDDDGDGVLTRNEENNTQDQNPLNDRTGEDIDDGVADGAIPLDYLNPNVNTPIPATAYREHTIYQEFIVSVVLNNLVLSSVNFENTPLDFGILDNTETSSSRTLTPAFP